MQDICKSSVVLTWNIPYDGGKKIFNYVIEKRETMSERWVRVTRVLNFDYIVKQVRQQFAFRI